MELDDESLKILKCFKIHKEPLSVVQLIIFTPYEAEDINECIAYLLSCKFIEVVKHPSSGEEMFRPTRKGKIVLENETKYRRNHRFNEFRAWITLFIAIVALILSIVK